MKKTILILGAVVIFMASFSKADLAKEKTVNATATVSSHALQSNPGEKLINKSDCLGCQRNFLNLAATGALDTTTFSRVVKGFVVQGGNLATREKISLELVKRSRRTVPDEPNAVKHVRGVVSMARGDEPNSATTHFFILVGEGSHLDGKFAAFGRVASGMDVADRINAAELDGETPKTPIRLNRATVAPCPAQPKPQATPESQTRPPE